jgi:Kef-type K+ transport system membrane component KefB
LYGAGAAGFGVAMWVVVAVGTARFGTGAGIAPAAGGGVFAGLAAGFHTPLGQLLLQLIVIVALAKCLGACFRRIGQPAVVGEMFAGLALGPSFLGAVAPGFTAFAFPPESLGALQLLSQIGVAVMLLLVAPALSRLVSRAADPARPGQGVVLVCLLSLFGAALTTEVIGIHALFGAFLAGVAMPKSLAFRDFLRDRLEYFGTVFLLPVFFAFTGLRTQVGLLGSADSWVACVLVVAVAVLGKIGGVAGAARMAGQSWRDAAALGVLMNTRGLMELIALNLGYDMKVLSPKLFTMLVLMALATTYATGPLLAALGYRQGIPRPSGGARS